QEMLDKTFDVGSAAKMMGIQAEGLAFKVKNLADRAKNLAISLGDAGVTGAIKAVIDSLRGLVTGIMYLTDSVIGSSILQIGIWTAAIYGAGAALKFLFMAVVSSGLLTSMGKLLSIIGA
ncbi:unnamed protein product, partial [marine sediment metagenome]